MSATTSLQSRVIETKLLKWKEFQFIQQDQFKDLSPEASDKLKKSILANQFTQPFYVWLDAETGTCFCLDGFHRVKALGELEADGHAIPEELPGTLIHCEDKQDAARLVLIYSSIYAKITLQGLFDFIQAYDLEYTDIVGQMDIPEFSTERFEQKFDLFDVTGEDEPEENPEPEEEVFVQPGDLFQINGHRIVCGSFKDAETVKVLMNGKKARIMNCDPPYNLPMNFFTTQDVADFAEGVGEMSDEEFVQFLVLVMQRGVENTVPGSIHYIFMDWRHVWHMTEAGRRVYGSVQPKQMCVWNKDLMGNGSFYRPKHELCFVFANPQAKALWNKDLLDHGGFYKDNNELVFIFKAGDDDVKHLSHLEMKDRIRTNSWNYPSANSGANPDRYELKNHPTPKPVVMIADAILDTTNPNDIVIDWFLGSGTCMIAADKTGRLCYGTEIGPLYVQLIIKRYLRHCEKNGREVNFSHLNGKLTIQHFSHVAEIIQ